MDEVLRQRKHRAQQNWKNDIRQYYIRRVKEVPDDMETAGIKLGFPKPETQYQKYYNTDCFNICIDCLRMGNTCEWLAFGEPVEGWNAERSKIYDDGFKIYGCPKYIDRKDVEL